MGIRSDADPSNAADAGDRQLYRQQDDIVVADGGDTATWMGMTRIIRKGGTYLDYGIYGCLAGRDPFRYGGQAENPDKRVLLIIGDGSVGFNFMDSFRRFAKNCRSWS